MRFEHHLEENNSVYRIEFIGEKGNSLDGETLRELTRVIRANTNHSIIISAVGRAFCAGLDLAQVLRDESAEELLRGLIDLFDALSVHPCPTACLIEARASGGGVGLALSTDVIVMSCNAAFELPPDPLYRPLAEVLFPIVAARRGIKREHFDAWYEPVSARKLLDGKHIDALVHQKTQPVTQKLRTKAELILKDRGLWGRTNLNHRGGRPDPADLEKRIALAVEVSRQPVFRVRVKAFLNKVKPDRTAVFLVHGRNTEHRDTVSKILNQAGLQHLTLRDVEKSIGSVGEPLWEIICAGLTMAQAIIVLLTGDDLAQLAPGLSETESRMRSRLINFLPFIRKKRKQARPNVLVEAGLALGIARHRTILVKFGSVDIPSDLRGHYWVEVPGLEDWKEALIQKLDSAGCQIHTRNSP